MRRAEAVERDLRWARRLWSEAAGAAKEEARRITLDHGDDVLRCAGCASLWRVHTVPADGCDGRYVEDRYGPEALQHIWSRCTAEYEDDRAWFTAQGLGPGVAVLEVGSYAGAFLGFAGALGCNAVGVDVNPEVVAWARGRGVDARLGPLRRDHWGAERFDQVWVLNCFEQVPDPDALLAEMRAVLRARGRLVVRTPNAAFLDLAYRWPILGLRRSAAANHVFGIPFLRCYTTAGLRQLLARNGFAVLSTRERAFTTVPTTATLRVAGPRWSAAAGRVTARLRPDAAAPWIDVVAVRARP